MSSPSPVQLTLGADAAPRQITARDMWQAVLKNLGLVPDKAALGREVEASPTRVTPLSVRGEALRAALWALTTGGSQPVYITRLLHAARPLAAPAALETSGSVSDDEAELTLLSQALDELEALGDVASLPRGRWLPAPLRCVPLPTIRRWVLLGGRPTGRLPAGLRESLEHNGVARLLTAAPIELGLPLAIEEEADWTRAPREPLREWARRVMEDASLRPFDVPEAAFELYAPAVGHSTLQYSRWVSNQKALPDGRYVARQRVQRGPTSYSVLELRGGRVVATGPLDLHEGDVRRLLYGLDSLAGRQVRVRVTPSGTAWVFELRNELPSAEHRLFTALGRLHLPPDGAYYPRRWEVANTYARQAAQALRALDVRLDGADQLLDATDDANSD
jgi:hypothetical protein